MPLQVRVAIQSTGSLLTAFPFFAKEDQLLKRVALLLRPMYALAGDASGCCMEVRVPIHCHPRAFPWGVFLTGLCGSIDGPLSVAQKQGCAICKHSHRELSSLAFAAASRGNPVPHVSDLSVKMAGCVVGNRTLCMLRNLCMLSGGCGHFWHGIRCSRPCWQPRLQELGCHCSIAAGYGVKDVTLGLKLEGCTASWKLAMRLQACPTACHHDEMHPRAHPMFSKPSATHMLLMRMHKS